MPSNSWRVLINTTVRSPGAFIRRYINLLSFAKHISDMVIQLISWFTTPSFVYLWKKSTGYWLEPVSSLASKELWLEDKHRVNKNRQTNRHCHSFTLFVCSNVFCRKVETGEKNELVVSIILKSHFKFRLIFYHFFVCAGCTNFVQTLTTCERNWTNSSSNYCR